MVVIIIIIKTHQVSMAKSALACCPTGCPTAAADSSEPSGFGGDVCKEVEPRLAERLGLVSLSAAFCPRSRDDSAERWPDAVDRLSLQPA